MQFLNPNVAKDMALLLQHNQEKYVLCLTNENNKTILRQIPLHCDHLFEEWARKSYGLTGMALMTMRHLKESTQSLLTGMQNLHNTR